MEQEFLEKTYVDALDDSKDGDGGEDNDSLPEPNEGDTITKGE